MKKKFVTKTLACILSLCMIFTAFCEIMPIEVLAADSGPENIGYQDFHLLGRGFNLLGDKQLENTYLESGLLKSDVGMSATRTHIGKTFETSSVITDMQEYIQNKVENWDVGIEFNAKTWAAAVGMKMKYQTADVSAYTKAMSSYFSSIDINAISYKYDMDINGDYYLLWDNLNDRFKEKLINEQNIEFLFEEYGTHMITRYQCGGWATSYSSAISDSYDFNNSAKASVNVETPISMGEDVFQVNYDIHAERKFEEIGKDKGSIVTSWSEVYGGKNFFTDKSDGTIDADAYNEWLTSLTQKDGLTGGNTTQILTDDQLELVAIWDIIPDKYAARKAKLEKYFNDAIEDNVSEFYGQFIYNKHNILNHPDFSKYADYTWISTPEELDSVRNNLNGKYFIINDIDLTNYDWEPIGTASSPFRGELIGNNVEILGLSCLVSGNDTRFPGILAYNSGIVSGIDISKWINYPVVIEDYDKSTPNVTYTSIASTPTNINTNGIVKIDWSSAGSGLNANKTITIGSNVSTLYLVGVTSTFTDLNFVVATRNTPIDIIMESFNYKAPKGKIAMDASAASKRVSIITKGINEIWGGSGTEGLGKGVASENTNSWGSSDIDGNSGGKGAVAIVGNNIVFEGTGKLFVVGGSGGSGGAGKDFNKVKQSGDNAAGYGGNGGSGGKGGNAIEAKTISLISGYYHISGGSGGWGGKGGEAPASYRDGQATAGPGGSGGRGGDGAIGINVVDIISVHQSIEKISVFSGSGGRGGDGGKGGHAIDDGK